MAADAVHVPSDDLSRDGATLTVHVRLAFRQRGGRKVIVSPAGEQHWTPRRPKIDDTLIQAVVRAFRWKQMLDEGRYATVSELATAHKLNTSYVAHVLRLTLLAPDLVDAILDGRQPATMQLQPLMRGFAVEWVEQRLLLC
jgi:hypothetical protein